MATETRHRRAARRRFNKTAHDVEVDALLLLSSAARADDAREGATTHRALLELAMPCCGTASSKVNLDDMDSSMTSPYLCVTNQVL